MKLYIYEYENMLLCFSYEAVELWTLVLEKILFPRTVVDM